MAMKKFKINKTDKRYAAHPHFKYSIISTGDRSGFFELREWLWQTYGPSKELNEWTDDLSKHNYAFYGPITHHNKNWCWHTDTYNRRIFLLGDEELVMFKLRFM
jgi:hypothetical protein